MEDAVTSAMQSVQQLLERFVPRSSSGFLVFSQDQDDFNDVREEFFDDAENSAPLVNLPLMQSFCVAKTGPVVSVDCGCKSLGETESGLIVVLRAAVIIDDGQNCRAKIYRTGPLYLSFHHKAEIFRAVGKCLGEPDYYVVHDETCSPPAIKIKTGVADKASHFSDRFRAFFERLVQRDAVAAVRNGTILFDGALTLRTRDCPDSYLRGLATLARRNGNVLIGVSKSSELQIRGRSVRFWLDDALGVAGYRDLTDLLDQGATRSRSERVIGRIYSARLSPFGPTLRVDVSPTRGGTHAEALDQFWSSSRMRGGYPDSLVRAHALSYFPSSTVVELQAQACVQYQLRPRAEIPLTGIFAPFGGRFK